MKNKLKYYFFLFRWFLIGRYHCDGAKKFRKYYDIIHKLLWLLITLGVIALCEKVLKWIGLY